MLLNESFVSGGMNLMKPCNFKCYAPTNIVGRWDYKLVLKPFNRSIPSGNKENASKNCSKNRKYFIVPELWVYIEQFSS